MNPGEFIELLENPERVERKSVEELKKLAVQYPYSQPVQLLYTIRLSRSGEYLFNRQLGKTSLLTADRSVLFDLFERDREEQQEDVSATEESQAEEKQYPEAEPFLKPDEAPAHEEENQKKSLEQPTEPVAEKEREDEPSAEDTPPAEPEPPTEEPSKKEEPPSERYITPADEKAGEPVPEALKFPAESKADDQKVSSKERIKTILQENRRLREEYEAKKKAEDRKPSEMDERIKAIKEKLSKLKRPEQAEEDPARPIASENTIEASEFPEEENLLPEEQEETIAEEAKKETSAGEPETEPEVTTDAEESDEGKLSAEAPEDLRETEDSRKEEEDGPAEKDEPAPQADDLPEVDKSGMDERPLEKNIGPQMDKSAETYTFADWLKKLKENESSAPETENNSSGAVSASPAPDAGFEKKIQLLDSFVEKLPQLKKKRNISVRPERSGIDMNKLSDEDGSLVTETLAQVYVRQNHYDKAIKAYEILKLKYPEKSSFFADRIFEIKKLIDNK